MFWPKGFNIKRNLSDFEWAMQCTFMSSRNGAGCSFLHTPLTPQYISAICFFITCCKCHTISRRPPSSPGCLTSRYILVRNYFLKLTNTQSASLYASARTTPCWPTRLICEAILWRLSYNHDRTTWCMIWVWIGSVVTMLESKSSNMHHHY
jgi:hypothetical protein